MKNFNNGSKPPFNNKQNNNFNKNNNKQNFNSFDTLKVSTEEKDQYINPYNFITLPEKCKRETSQNRKGNLNGYIECTLTAKTPIMVPDTSETQEKGFKEYKFFNYQEINKENNFVIPVIPGSEIRGMLRSDYEVFTDSCMSTLSDDISFISRTREIKLPGILEKNVKDGKVEWHLYKATRYSLHTCRKEGNNNIGYPKTANGTNEAVYMVDNKNRITVNEKIYKTGDTVKFKSNSNKLNPKALEIGTGNLEGILFIGEIGGKKDRNQIHDSVLVKTNEELKVNDLNKEVEKLKAIYDLYNDKAFNQKIRNSNKTWYAGYDIDNSNILPVWYSALDSQGRTYLSLAAIGKEAYHRNLSELVGEFMPCTNRNNICNCCNLFGFVSDEDSDSSKIRISDAIYTNSENPYYIKMIIKELASPHISNASFYALYNPNTNWESYSRNFDFNYDFVRDGKQKQEINSKDITIRGRKQYWHHYNENNIKTEQKTDRNCAITPVKIGTEFKFKIYFNDIKKENLDELISVINLNYDDKHDLCHKIGKGKPLGFGSCKLKVEEVYIKDIKKENDTLKYDMKNYDSYFNVENSKLEQVSLKQFVDVNTIPMKEALRIYDFNYISKFYKGVKVQYPVAEKKKEDNSMNWFMLNKSTDLKNSYIVMVLPRIIDCIDENNQDNIKKVKLKIKDNIVGTTKGLIHPKYKM